MDGKHISDFMGKRRGDLHLTVDRKRLTNSPVRQAGYVLKCPDDPQKQSCQRSSDVPVRRFSSWWPSLLAAVLSVKASVLQPQLSRQAGDGDTDDDDFKSKSEETAGAVRRTNRRTTLDRSHPPNPCASKW